MSTDTQQASAVTKGLKGILAADSSICQIDGTEGRLLYRGYNIDELAEQSSFEEVAYLLLRGELPTRAELKQFESTLVKNRALPAQVTEFIESLPRDVVPMAALRSALSIAGIYDPMAEDESAEANDEKSIRLVGVTATIVAAIHRVRNGQEPLEPRDDLGFAANFMYMIKGSDPTPDEVRAMDLILILHAEHGFNASTFTARVVIATLTDLYSAVTGAAGALKGKLHGGANTEVLKTLVELGSVDNVASWVDDVRSRKGKFMGFGHAVYQTEDPRAKHLKELSRRLGDEQNDTKWYDISVEIEKRVSEAIGKNCNVDFYSASLQHYMGIPKELFTCIFASSRMAGWCAHILEQLSDNKIIRPSCKYVGYDEREFREIDQR